MSTMPKAMSSSFGKLSIKSVTMADCSENTPNIDMKIRIRRVIDPAQIPTEINFDLSSCMNMFIF
jgi:hypothetical protein